MTVTKYLLSLSACMALLLCCLPANAQFQDPGAMSAGKLKKLALNAERYGDIYTALIFYAPYAEKKDKSAEAQFHLGELYERTRDYPNAAAAYLQAFELDASNPNALINHARMLKMSGEPAHAREKFEIFSDLIRKNGYGSDWRRTVREEIIGCDTALALMERPLNVEIDHAGDGVNGPHAEFSPIPFGGKKLLYGAIKETEIRYFHLDSTTTRRRLYVSEKAGDVWLESDLWDVPFNSGSGHIVNGSFSHDESMFVYTACRENWKKEMECALWLVHREGETWSEPEKFDETINAPGFIVTQPALAYDTRKEQNVLYYVSNQPGGQGGMDIWYTYFDKRRKNWRKPRNLGRRLNGPGDEVTPYYNEREKKLYFSSSSHPGMGGLDVFSSRGELQRFAKPENIGFPLNSSVDELYFVLKNDRESGYFVSNRKGGYQMMNETCCDDIYEFFISDVVHIVMDGFVMRVNEEEYVKGEGDKLSSKAFGSDFLDGVNVELFLIEEGEEVLMERKTTDGDGKYVLDFEPEKEYRVVLSRDGFFSNHIDVDTRNRTRSDTIFQNVGLSVMTGKSIVMDNILFDFDSSALTEASKTTIQSGILRALKENPQLIVEISAHTDNKGDAAYNEKLSQQRAESVTRFLTSNGIGASRLKAKGYGESKPIAPNTNADGSDNPEGRTLNRRTEFTILGALDLQEAEDDDEDESED